MTKTEIEIIKGLSARVDSIEEWIRERGVDSPATSLFTGTTPDCGQDCRTPRSPDTGEGYWQSLTEVAARLIDGINEADNLNARAPLSDALKNVISIFASGKPEPVSERNEVKETKRLCQDCGIFEAEEDGKCLHCAV